MTGRRIPRPAVTTVLVLLLTLLAGGSPARAQEAELRPGDRIQVTSPALVHWRAEGTLVSVDAGRLELRRDGAEEVAAVPLSDVDRLRVHRGRGDARWRGAFLGAPAGFIVGLVVDEETRADQDIDTTRKELWFGGMAAGAVAGWLVGRLIPTDEWVEVSPAALRAGGGPGVGVGVRLELR